MPKLFAKIYLWGWYPIFVDAVAQVERCMNGGRGELVWMGRTVKSELGTDGTVLTWLI